MAKHVLQIMSANGDDTHEWSDDLAGYQEAVCAFGVAQLNGYVAYTFDEKTQTGEVTKTLDPKAERTIMRMQMAGG